MNESKLVTLGVRIIGIFYLLRGVAGLQSLDSLFQLGPWRGLPHVLVPSALVILACVALRRADAIGKALANPQDEEENDHVSEQWASWALTVAGVALFADTLMLDVPRVLMAWHEKLASLGAGVPGTKNAWLPTLALAARLAICAGVAVGPRRFLDLLRNSRNPEKPISHPQGEDS